MLFAVFFHVAIYDIWFYVTHRLLHIQPFYTFHKIHHRTPYESLDWHDSYRAHIVENVLQNAGILIPFAAQQILHMQITNMQVLCIAYAIVCIRGVIRHEHRLTWLGGNHHQLHHKYSDYNYSEYWLDSLMGTCYPGKSDEK